MTNTKAAARKRLEAHYATDFTVRGPFPAAIKLSLAGQPFSFRLVATGHAFLTAGQFVPALSMDDVYATVKAHAATWRGEAVWAEDRDGLIIYGYDSQGQAAPVSNLESIRAWHLNKKI